MPKLPALNVAKIIKLLEKRGFILDRSSGSHRVYRHPDTHRIVIVPFHRKDLPKGTLLEILKQAGLKKAEIKDV